MFESELRQQNVLNNNRNQNYVALEKNSDDKNMNGNIVPRPHQARRELLLQQQLNQEMVRRN